MDHFMRKEDTLKKVLEGTWIIMVERFGEKYRIMES
jgi:hypothetical protein